MPQHKLNKLYSQIVMQSPSLSPYKEATVNAKSHMWTKIDLLNSIKRQIPSLFSSTETETLKGEENHKKEKRPKYKRVQKRDAKGKQAKDAKKGEESATLLRDATKLKLVSGQGNMGNWEYFGVDLRSFDAVGWDQEEWEDQAVEDRIANKPF